MIPRSIKAADLFCGASGTGTGIEEACEELEIDLELSAWNHWEVAIATSKANHPKAKHFCASLDNVNPRDHYKEGELDLLWASPECTHHSIARGGKPINDQSRATAFCVVRWAEALRPPIILVENVKEFLTWGPIGSNGRPLKSRRGEIFHSWVKCLEAIGYRVEWRILCAADYGDPTTRQRLFIYAVRGRRKIVWPEPTHAPEACTDMFGARKRWVPARDIIDWALEGKSIFKRKKPLADKTLNRIAIGLEKFGLKPFIVPNFGERVGQSPRVHSISEPLPSVTGHGAGVLAEPFLVHLRGNCDAKDLSKPAPAITAGGGHLGLAEPYLIQVNHGNGKDPNGDERRVRSADVPFPTVAGNRGEWALCEPFVIGQQSGAVGRPVSQPAPTVSTAGAISLVQPFIMSAGGPEVGAISVDRPMNTVLTRDHMSLVQPCLISFYGTSDAQSIESPLPTVTTKDRFGLVMPTVEIEGEKYLLDIRFRMLKAHELAAAQGFPKGYKFTGNKTQIVKQIGNAVPKNLAKALVKAALTQSSS
jgi:DNA (cytosine-5)-methyltransferase 1